MPRRDDWLAQPWHHRPVGPTSSDRMRRGQAARGTEVCILTTAAGQPATTAPGGTSFVTSDPAAATAVADRHALQHDRVEADPHVVANDHRPGVNLDLSRSGMPCRDNGAKVRVAGGGVHRVAVGVVDVDAVGDQDATADPHGARRPDSRTVADITVFSDLDFAVVSEDQQFAADEGASGDPDTIGNPGKVADACLGQKNRTGIDAELRRRRGAPGLWRTGCLFLLDPAPEGSAASIPASAPGRSGQTAT